MFALRRDQSEEIYRFLWLRSLSRPISVRLVVHADGSGSITSRSVDVLSGVSRVPGSDTGGLVLDVTTKISKATVQDVLDQLQAASFWLLATQQTQVLQGPFVNKGPAGFASVPAYEVDGSQWILEGLRNGKYHVVDRWSPNDDSGYARLCKLLLSLGNIKADSQ